MKILAHSLTEQAIENFNEAGIDVIDTKVAKEQLLNYCIDNQLDAIVFDHIDDFNAEFIDNCHSLKLIVFKDTIDYNADVEYAKEQGIQVLEIADASANASAELVFAHLFGMSRFLHQANREMPLEGDMNFSMLRKAFTGVELKGKTLGIIGMDTTGVEIAKKAIGLGMEIKMTDHEPKNVLIPIEFFDGQTVEFYIESSDFNEILDNSDFIVVNTYSESRYIIDNKEFEQMKSVIGLVNLYQGAINEIALLHAIEKKQLSFAGLDAFENQPNPEIQLLMKPELSLSPNIGTKTYEVQKRLNIELVSKVIEALNI